jgi:histidinol phosphatase-like PHP family hydrolase
MLPLVTAIHDFHTHTYLTDGTLSPLELIQHAIARGYAAIAVTDHVALHDQERILEVLVRDCALATKEMGILAIPGVELTQVPPDLIGRAAHKARSLGAQIVLVHGETTKEPVSPGTNFAAITSGLVDILAHPGLLTAQEAALAKAHGVYLELTSRNGHSITNGHVARVAMEAGAPLIVDSDAHQPEDLLTPALATAVALGAGLDAEFAATVLQSTPKALLQLLERRKRTE